MFTRICILSFLGINFHLSANVFETDSFAFQNSFTDCISHICEEKIFLHSEKFFTENGELLLQNDFGETASLPTVHSLDGQLYVNIRDVSEWQYYQCRKCGELYVQRPLKCGKCGNDTFSKVWKPPR